MSARLFSVVTLILILLSTTIVVAVQYHSISSVLAADLTGTERPNTIYGTMGDDDIVGHGGKDSLYGNGGRDVIHGNDGDDNIDGELGKDTVEGNDGNDIVQGGSGADKINGGKGNDTLMASFALGAVSFRDYAVDIITCGSGFDTAYYNPVDGDTISPDCESLIVETSAQ